ESCKSHQRPRKRLLLNQFGGTEEAHRGDPPQAPAPQQIRRRLRKPIEETPQTPAPQTPQAPAPKRTRITTKPTVPHILPPSGAPQGGAFGVAVPKARAKPRAKAKYEKPVASVNNTIEELIESSKLPPGQQGLLPKHHLTTKAAHPNNNKKKKCEGIDPTWNTTTSIT
ncbi:MAG: hypothetical protein ACKPKO_25040, partial [Candidatus Fonsibacter sp.]